MRRESERKAAATADGTRIKIQVPGQAHTEGDINKSCTFTFINSDGTANSADITSPANRTCGQAQGPFRRTRRIAAMALHIAREEGWPGDYPALSPLGREVILLVQVLANIWQSMHIYAYISRWRYLAG